MSKQISRDAYRKCERGGMFRRMSVGLFMTVGLLGCGTEGEHSAEKGLSYAITEVGPSGNRSMANDVNSSGLVVGSSGMNDPTSGAFRWAEGVTTGLAGRAARAVNENGVVVGEAGGVAYVWGKDGGISALTYGTAHGVNSSGLVVGEALTVNGHLHAFLWSNDTIIDLDALGGDWSVAYDVNEAGQVVGWAETAQGQARAFIWHNGTMVELEGFGGWSMAYAVNDDGQVVGYATDTNGTDRAFLSRIGINTVDLGSLGGYSVAHDIDNLGRVVGESATSTGRTHAFLWQDAQMTDLNDLLPPGSGWELIRATAINDAGQIVGQGILDGQRRPFMLTPDTSGSD